MKSSKILIGGCSSVGKTTISDKLSKYLGVTHCQLDKMWKNSDNPVFKQLDDLEVWDNDPEHLVNIIKQQSFELKPTIKKWCLNEQNGLLEGEGIEPNTVSELSNIDNLKVIYIIETDSEYLHSTLYKRAKKYRDLSKKRQEKVVAMNIEYSKFLQLEAVKYDQAWVYSRPWETLHERILKHII